MHPKHQLKERLQVKKGIAFVLTVVGKRKDDLKKDGPCRNNK